MAWGLTQSGFSRALAAAMTGLPGGPATFIAVSILAFVILGSVLEGIPAIVLFGPLLFPIAHQVGVHEVHYAMRLVLGRGVSDPSSMFVDEARGFLGKLPAGMPLPAWLTEADIAEFAEGYRHSGFRGGLNWYRNLDRNWELTAPWQDAQIHQPSLFIAGSNDSVITGLIGAKRVADMPLMPK